jgi:hypothetical protein
MSYAQEIEKLALDTFSFLCSKYQFMSPLTEHVGGRAMTVMYYMKGDIAVEIQLDWMDLHINLMMVQLESGQLPDGYYASNNHVCRVHLPILLREKGWADAQTLEPFFYKKKKRKPAPSSLDKMRGELLQYHDLLKGSIDIVLNNKESIFDDRLFRSWAN